jgi:hypothetical protein
MLQGFFHHKGEMGTFGAVAVIVFALVAVPFHGVGEHLLGLLYLHADLGQVRQFHGRTVLLNQGFQIKPVEIKATIFDIETFLWEIESLFHQVGVRVVHELVRVTDGNKFKRLDNLVYEF